MKPYYQGHGVTIYHAQCMQVLPDLGPVDLLLTDPPYGLGKAWARNVGGGFMDKDQAAQTRDWDSQAPDMAQVLGLVDYTDAIIWGGNYFDLPPCPRLLIWDKQNQGMHFAEAEVAWTDFDKGSTRILNYGIRGSEVFGSASERQHPTQKPLAVMEWCLTFAPGSVLDPFMGSGTSLVAAVKYDRPGIGIEVQEQYCEIAANRVQAQARGISYTEQTQGQMTLWD